MTAMRKQAKLYPYGVRREEMVFRKKEKNMFIYTDGNT